MMTLNEVLDRLSEAGLPTRADADRIPELAKEVLTLLEERIPETAHAAAGQRATTLMMAYCALAAKVGHDQQVAALWAAEFIAGFPGWGEPL